MSSSRNNLSCNVLMITALQLYEDLGIHGKLKKRIRKYLLAILTTYTVRRPCRLYRVKPAVKHNIHFEHRKAWSPYEGVVINYTTGRGGGVETFQKIFRKILNLHLSADKNRFQAPLRFQRII